MRISLVSLFALALLSACASTHRLRPEATLVQPDSLQTHESLRGITLDAAAWPKAQWWLAYGDTQLNDLINEALAGNPGLRIAAARTQQRRSHRLRRLTARAAPVRA